MDEAAIMPTATRTHRALSKSLYSRKIGGIIVRIAVVVGAVLIAMSLYTPADTTPPPPPHVKVAFDIYAGCMGSAINVANTYVDRNIQSLQEYTKQADENCVGWMVVWYHSLVPDSPHIDTWDKPDFAVLENMRKAAISQFESTIKKELKIK